MSNTPLAMSDTDTVAAPPNLFAGSAEVTTNRAKGAAGVTLAEYTVIALVADEIVQWDPTGSGAVTIPVGILAAPLATAAAWCPYYTGGDFNHASLVWPASIDTFAERRAAFAQTSTVKISKVL